jgi:pseudoazurin
MKKHIFALATLGALMLGGQALAANHEIKMLNSGPDGIMVFEPGFLQVAPGDTVTFVSAEPGHNSASHYGPEGGATWKGEIGKDVSVTLDKEGVYIYKCEPHIPLGMIGVIQVGAAANKAEAKAAAEEFKGSIAMNKDRLDKYIGQVK